MGKSGPRILLLDIETMPDLEEALKVFSSLSHYPGLTLKASINSIICFGFKWFGEGRSQVLSAWDFKSWRKNINDDKALIEAAYEIIKKADVVVTHNGKKFDWKFIQTRLLKHKLPPLPPLIHIDTCAEAKKHLLVFNNRLNTLSKFLSTPQKLENGGWELWVEVANRNKAAIKLMEKYCRRDVDALEGVFQKLRPLVKLPNARLFYDSIVCPICGSPKLQARGFRVQKTKRCRRFQCQACGAWSSADAKGVLTL